MWGKLSVALGSGLQLAVGPLAPVESRRKPGLTPNG